MTGLRVGGSDPKSVYPKVGMEVSGKGTPTVGDAETPIVGEPDGCCPRGERTDGDLVGVMEGDF